MNYCLHDIYDSYNDFALYDVLYDIAKKMGHKCSEDCWQANPTVEAMDCVFDNVTIFRAGNGSLCHGE